MVDPTAVKRLLKPDDCEVSRVMMQVCTTSFVSGNAHHSQIASQSWLHFCPADADPNACAFVGEEPCSVCSQLRPANKPLTIAVNAGLVRLFGLLAALVTAPLLLHRGSGRYVACRDRLFRCAGLLSEPDGIESPLAAGIQEHAIHACCEPGVLPLALDLANGMLALTLAHELAHLSFGHVQGTGTAREITRNSEREADSFAASVLVSLPNPDRTLVGGVAFWGCLALAERHHRSSILDTHPRSLQRLASLIDSAPSAMQAAEAAHGLSRDGLLSLIA